MKRWLKRVAIVAGALLALVLVALVAAWLYVTSEAGSERVRAEVLSVLGHTLAGRFEAKRLSLSGGIVVIEDLKLYTPEGELVGELHRAELEVALGALLEKNVVLRSAHLTGVRLYLVHDERGLNMVRAVALQHPSPPSKGPGPSFFVDVRKLALDDSYVSYPPYALSGIALAGGATVAGPTLRLDGKLAGNATLDGDTPLPLSLAVASASETGSGFKLDVVAGLGDAKLDGTLHVPKVAAEVRTLVVPRDVARRFLPDSPLEVTLGLHGTVDLSQAALALEAGHATAKLEARYHDATIDALQLEAHAVDLSELLGKGQPSLLELSASGRLNDGHPASLDGALQATAAWTTADGRALAGLSLDVLAAQGMLMLKRADLTTPGAALHARGDGNLEALHLKGELDATDLGQLSKVIGEFTGAAAPPLGGRGKLAVAVNGAARHPSVSAQGTFETLRAGSLTAHAVRADVRFADIARPFEAQVQLDAAQVLLAERELDDVHAHVGTQGRALEVEVSTRGLADLELQAQGQLDDDARGIALAKLQLHTPEEDWTLEAPTHLGLGDGFALDVTRLGSGDQRIELRAVQRDGRLDAGLDAQRVDLAKLPRALLPASLNLGGVASAHATAAGASEAPQLDAQLSVRDGTLRNVSKVSLDVNASYGKQRLQVRGTGRTSLGSVDGAVDLPVKGDGPLTAHVVLKDVLLEGLGPLLERDVPVSGRGSLVLDASGTAQRPQGTLHAEVTDAELRLTPNGEASPTPAVADRSDTVGTAEGQSFARGTTPDAERPVGQPPSPAPPRPGTRGVHVERLVLDVAPDSEGKLAAMLNAHAFGADADVKLASTLTLEALRRKVPDAAALQALPFDVQADVRQLDLRKLVEARLLETDLEGHITLTAHGTGTLQHPDLDATVAFGALHSTRLKPLDGQLSLATTRKETRAHLSIGHSVLLLDAHAELPLEQLAHVDALARATFQAEGKVGPFTVDEVLQPTPDQPRPKGTLSATLTASGTAEGPKVQVRGQVDHLVLGKAPLGHADLALDYADAVTTLAAAVVNEAAGRMDAKGRLTLDLSEPAVLKGVDWKRAPLSLEVVSKSLELAWLSGLSDRVPKVGGTLDADAKLSGPLGDPVFAGHAAWKNGALAVMGYGDYRDIAVELDGSDEAVTLQQLYAKSSGGFVKLEGAAMKKPGGWQVHASGETQRFPVIVDDQLKATASVEVQVEGTVSPTMVDLHHVRVPHATLELPDVKSKDLQDLDRPANIVLVRNGVPVNAAQERKMVFGKGKRPPSPVAARTTLRMKLQAPRNIWVKSSDLQIELGLSDDFLVEVDGVAALAGDVSVKRGRIEVIGRRFDVDPTSTVHFNGPANRAYVNVTATHKNDREGVTVTAVVTGQLPQFAIHLTSNPPLAESDIFTLVATGRRQLKEGSGQTITGEQAASVVGAFAASQVKGALSKKVPIDVLSVEAGTDGFKGTRVEAGKYITDKVYVGAEVRYGADPRKGENTAAAKLEYQFTPHWSLDIYGGDAGAFGADLIWSHDY